MRLVNYGQRLNEFAADMHVPVKVQPSTQHLGDVARFVADKAGFGEGAEPSQSIDAGHGCVGQGTEQVGIGDVGRVTRLHGTVEIVHSGLQRGGDVPE